MQLAHPVFSYAAYDAQQKLHTVQVTLATSHCVHLLQKHRGLCSAKHTFLGSRGVGNSLGALDANTLARAGCGPSDEPHLPLLDGSVWDAIQSTVSFQAHHRQLMSYILPCRAREACIMLGHGAAMAFMKMV